MTKSSFRQIPAITIAGVIAVAMALPATAAPFYKGRTLNIIINYSAGGNTDIQGRSALRFMRKFIPGKPRILVRNLPGAGGIVATNFLGEAARNDGYTLGVFTIPIMAEIMKDPAMRVSLSDFIMIGSIAQQTIAHIRKDVSPGMNKPADILKANVVFKTSGHGPSSSKDLRTRMFMELLGIKYKHVTGYKSSGRIRTAILQNEIQFSEDSLTGYIARVVPNLIKPGISIPVWHLGHPTEDNSLRRSDYVSKDIPSFLEIYQMKYGKGTKPKGIKWEAILLIAKTREMLRSFFLPKGAPKQAVDILRAAWVKTMADPGYQKEYVTLNASKLSGYDGETATKLLADAVNVRPGLRKWLLDYADKGRN